MLALLELFRLLQPVNRQGDEYNPPARYWRAEKTVRDIPVRYGVKWASNALLSAFTASGLAKSTFAPRRV